MEVINEENICPKTLKESSKKKLESSTKGEKLRFTLTFSPNIYSQLIFVVDIEKGATVEERLFKIMRKMIKYNILCTLSN